MGGDEFRAVINNTDHSEDGGKKQEDITRWLAKFLTDQGIDIIICNIGMTKENIQANREMIKNYYDIFLDVRIYNEDDITANDACNKIIKQFN